MFLKVYTQYVNHFNKAITIVARLKRTSEDFRAFLMVPTSYSPNSPPLMACPMGNFFALVKKLAPGGWGLTT